MTTPRSTRFAICLRNDGCDDLIVSKVYRVLPDDDAAKSKHMRIVDESGEDYLYPASYFFPIEVPPKVTRALKAAVE